MDILHFLFSRSRSIIASMILLLVSGTICFLEMPYEDAADVVVPVILTKVGYDGISSANAERLITKPLEHRLRGIDGVKEIRSESYFGGSTVILEFEDGFNPKKALTDVRYKIDLAQKNFPIGSGKATVHEVNLSLSPVLTITISGNLTEPNLLHLGRILQTRIESLAGVREAKLVGDLVEVLELIVDPLQLQSYGINNELLIKTMQRSNRLIAAGNLEIGLGRFSIKVPSLFSSIEEIGSVPVKVFGDSVVRVRDIAKIQKTFKDRKSDIKINGKAAIAIEISKNLGTLVIEVSDAVRSLIITEVKNWPENVEINYPIDKSWKLRFWFRDIKNNLLSSILFVSGIIFFCSGFRSAILASIAISGAFLTGITLITAVGLVTNTMVLVGICFGAGLIIDSTIVLVEYADRKTKMGRFSRKTFELATRRMVGPLISSFLALMAAFLPIFFLQGTLGELIEFLPITVLLLLVSSLILILSFIPVLGVAIGQKVRSTNAFIADIGLKESVIETNKTRGGKRLYLVFLGFVLNHPAKVVFLAILMLLWVPWLYGNYGQGIHFFPDESVSHANLIVHARGNLSLTEQRTLVDELESEISSLDSFSSIFTTIGETVRGSGAQDVIARMQLQFKNWQSSDSAQKLLRQIESRTKHVPGLKIEILLERAGISQDKAIQIELISNKFEAIAPVALDIQEYLERMAYVVNVEHSLPVPGIDWELKFDRAQAMKYGVDTADVAKQILLATKGLKLADYRPDDAEEKVDIVLRYPRHVRSAHHLDTLKIGTPQGLIPITSFAEWIAVPSQGAIRRVNGRHSMLIKADVDPRIQPKELLGEIEGLIKTKAVGTGVLAKFKGKEEDKEEAEAGDFLAESIGLALGLMMIIFVAHFDSFFRAGLILFSLCLSLVGVILGLLVTNLPVSILMSGIGFMALVSVVMSQTVFLVNTFDRLIGIGVPGREAILRTLSDRLKPILLATVILLVVLAPFVFDFSFDFSKLSIRQNHPALQFWHPFASAVFFGLIFALLITLVFVPAALMLRVRFDENQKERRLWLRATFRRLVVRGPIETVVTILSVGVAWFLIFEMIIVRIFDITTKQFANPPSVWFQAVEWAAFWTFIILTVAYAYLRDGHVRVDIIREQLSKKFKAIVEIIGFLLLLAPVCIIVIYFSFDYVGRSFEDQEISGALLGSPTQFIFKAMMPFGFLMLLLVGLTITVRNLRLLLGLHRNVAPERNAIRQPSPQTFSVERWN